MSIGVHVEVFGGPELQRKLRRLDEKLQKQIVKKAARTVADVVLVSARQLCPVETGALRGSLKRYAAKARFGIGYEIRTGERPELNIAPDDPYYYPSAVEFGHGNVPAHSFMRAAMDRHRAWGIAEMGRQIDAGIQATVKT